MSTGSTRRRVVAAGLAAATAFALAACSSGSSADSAGAGQPRSAETAQCEAAANQFLQPYTQLPTALAPDLKPLAAKPAPGGRIIQLANGSGAADIAYGKAMGQAASVVGWSFEQLTIDGSVEDLNAKFQQAVDADPTAIVVGGQPASTFAAPLKAAMAKKIITMTDGGAETANLDTGPTVVNIGIPGWELQGEVSAYKFLADSRCSGSVLVVTTEYPSIDAAVEKFKSVVADHCSTCKVTVKSLQGKDIGTPGGINGIVSALQADPQTTYVFATLGGLVDGLLPALSAASINDTKIFGTVPTPQAVANLRDGKYAWFLNQGPTLDGWAMMHGLLYAKETGQALNFYGTALTVLTPKDVPAGTTDVPAYPTNYQDLFKKLWSVE